VGPDRRVELRTGIIRCCQPAITAFRKWELTVRSLWRQGCSQRDMDATFVQSGSRERILRINGPTSHLKCPRITARFLYIAYRQARCLLELTINSVSLKRAPHGILGGPWPTQKFLWVGHNAFGPPKKCRRKIKYSYCFQCLRNFFCQLPFGFHCPTDCEYLAS
jgi:hypothetical protein